MDIENLKELYVEELKDLYSAEQQLLKALPRMARKATNPLLQRAFLRHERETQGQVRRLDRIFAQLGERAGGKKCVGMEGLIEEAKELMQEDITDEALDAGLISKAQHVEHYEMAGYGTVRTYARLLGLEDQAQLLQQTLDEEGNTDELLDRLAQSINVEAIDAEADEEEETRGRRSAGKRGGRKSAAKRGGRKAGAKKAASKRGGRTSAKKGTRKAAKRARR